MEMATLKHSLNVRLRQKRPFVPGQPNNSCHLVLTSSGPLRIANARFPLGQILGNLRMT